MLTPILLSLLAPGAEAGELPPLTTRDCYDQGREVRGYGMGAGAVLRGSAGSAAASAAAPVAKPKQSTRQQAPRAEAETRSAPSNGLDVDALDISGDLAPPSASSVAEPGLMPGEHDIPEVGVLRHQPPGPTVAWGGSIHLSNDDSMSLASAQRLLWAVERDAPVDLSEIRPHEFLNYLGFPYQEPTAGQTFGVHGSAEVVEGDTLAVALSVAAAVPDRAPLDLTILVDRSGSMSSEGRMTYVQRALQLASHQLRRGDRVDLVLFDDRVCTPVQDFVVGRDAPHVLTDAIDQMHPRGSTDLDLGLREAYAVARSHGPHPGRSGRVMVLTDALLNTGDVDPHTVSEVGRALDAHGIRLTGVGVGHQFRDDVLDKLTEKGKGAYVFLGSGAVVDRMFGEGFEALVHTVAHDVRFRLDLPPSLGLTRFYGEESSRDPVDVQPVHVHAGTRQLFLQDLAMKDGTAPRTDRLTLDIRWDDPLDGRPRHQAETFTVGQLLDADPLAVRKARAVIAWTDVVAARAAGEGVCPAVWTFADRAAIAGPDAELAHLDGLTAGWCQTPERPTPVSTRIRLDAGSTVAEVSLHCGRDAQRRPLGAGERVATFETRPGTCLVRFDGPPAAQTTVRVPATGATLQCRVRGQRASCW